MADRHLFVLQRSLSIGFVAAGIGLMIGLNIPVNPFINQTADIPKTLPIRQPNREASTSQVKVLIAQQNQTHKKLIAKLIQEEKVRRLNSPLPVQFQGKTIREVHLNSQDKAIAREASTKPIAPGASAKLIALTFDDGPWPTTTSQVLDVLKNNNVKATFFVVGKQVQQYPQLLKQVVAGGHALGNHSWSHQYRFFDESAAARELDETATLVYKISGIKTFLFRPPGGMLNNGLAAYAQNKKHAVIMWSADSKDWRHRRNSTQALIDSVLEEAKPGGIVLLHDGGGDRSNTVQALPQLIAQLKKRGYKFVTVPELLEISDKESKANRSTQLTSLPQKS
ncbi:MAG TPA: polysaccharide deacetylase family protein [Coleofasciculaceae cyanobacterium]